MTKKGSSVFFQEKIGVIPSVAAPGDINPSDATALFNFSTITNDGVERMIDTKIRRCSC